MCCDDVEFVVDDSSHAVLVVFYIMSDIVFLLVVLVGSGEREDGVEGIGVFERARERLDSGQCRGFASLGVRQNEN